MPAETASATASLVAWLKVPPRDMEMTERATRLLFLALFTALCNVSMLREYDNLKEMCHLPVDAGENTRVRARSIGSQNLHTDDVGTLGHSVSRTGDCARAVGTVSVTISSRLARDEVGTHSSTASKLVVSSVDTGVDNVDVAARACRVVVDVARLPLGSVGDTSQAILCSTLGNQSTLVQGNRSKSIDLRVWLNALHLCKVCNEVDKIIVTIECEGLFEKGQLKPIDRKKA